MNFFGLLTFNAPYLPWVLLGFSLLLGNSVSVDLLGDISVKTDQIRHTKLITVGMAVGHCYYFLEDIFPNQPGGWKMLKTPHFLQVLCDPAPEDVNYRAEPEERPGGFQWGQQEDGAEEEED